MAHELALAGDLEVAIASGSPARRTQILRAVTDLFIASGVRAAAETDVFDDVMGRLAQHMESAARAELAQRLAPLEHAPARVVNTLAQDDDIAVAGPLLACSTVLPDEAIMRGAQTLGQAHLLAISRRRSLSEAITDVLVERGDRNVVRATAGNAGARFSDRGFQTLVQKSGDDDSLALVVGARHDIPAPHFERLVAEASQMTRDKLAGAHPHLASLIGDVVQKVAHEVRESSRAAARDYTAAYEKIEGLKLRGPLREEHVFEFASRAMFEEMAVSIATLADLPVDRLEKALLASDPDQALIITRALDLPWPTVKAVFVAARQAADVPVGDFTRMQEHFERIQVPTAQRIVRFYADRLATP